MMYEPTKGQLAASKYETVHKQLQGVETQLKQKEADLARLEVRAPRAGTIIPPPRSPERPRSDEGALSTWSGTPLDKSNLGASMSPQGQQNLICMIGDPNEWDAVLVIDQDNSNLVREGQEVRLMFESSAYHVYFSTISRINSGALSAVSPRLASTSGGPLAAQQNPDGTISPLNTSFQAIARLHDPRGLLRNGLIGAARIETQPRTIAWRVGRYLSRTFNFEL